MARSDDDALEQAFLAAQEAAVVEIADQGLVSLAQLVQSQAIDVAPKFQRRDRWDPIRQSRLIESFLSNIPVPPVYLAEDSGRIGRYAVIDGKQRLTAVSTFFANALELSGLTRLPLLNGRTYDTLPASVRSALGMKNLRVTTLLRQSNEELKHEVFIRLNTGGEVLNAQEVRNVAYRGTMNDLVYELSENKFLRAQFKVVPPNSPNYRQMTDAEYVLRFFALASSWNQFKGDIRVELDRFMITNLNPPETQLGRLRRRFEETISAAQAIWGGLAFKWPGRDQALAGLFDAQMIALSELTGPERSSLVTAAENVRTETAELFADRAFEEAVRQATNTPARLRSRINAMKRRLARVLEAV
jgi:hypothetical protein